MQRWSGVLLIVISAASFGAMPILARLAYDDGASVNTVLFLRFSIASAAMLLLMLLRRIPFPRGKILLGLVLLGGLGYFGQSFSYFNALLYASPALVALLLYLYPSLVTLMAALLFKEKLTPPRIGALLLALTGAALTIGAVGTGEPIGIVLGIAAAVIYSLYIVAGSRFTAHSGAIASSTVIMLSAACVYTVLITFDGFRPPATASGWAAVFTIALLCTVVAIVTFFAGLAQVGASNAATLSTLEPAITVLLAALILGDALSPVQLIGGLLILIAVLILARNSGHAAPRIAPSEA